MKEFLQKHRKRIVTGAVVLCVLGGGTYYYMDSLNANQAQTLYTTGKVEKGDVKTSISATGTINPVNYVDVSTNVAGKLEKVLVKENDQVTAGQVIAYIDTRQLQASVDDARAALAKAELDMNRYKSLAAQDAIAQQTYDDSVTTYERAKSTYERAAADLSDATITAPMSGTVVGTPLKAGQTISTGISTQMIIATIADLKNLEIYLTVDETDIGNIKHISKLQRCIFRIISGRINDFIIYTTTNRRIQCKIPPGFLHHRHDITIHLGFLIIHLDISSVRSTQGGGSRRIEFLA